MKTIHSEYAAGLLIGLVARASGQDFSGLLCAQELKAVRSAVLSVPSSALSAQMPVLVALADGIGRTWCGGFPSMRRGYRYALSGRYGHFCRFGCTLEQARAAVL